MTISDEDLEKMSEMFKARMREVIKPQFERRDAMIKMLRGYLQDAITMKCGSCKICMTQKNFEYHAHDCETIARWRKAVDDTRIIEEM